MNKTLKVFFFLCTSTHIVKVLDSLSLSLYANNIDIKDGNFI